MCSTLAEIKVTMMVPTEAKHVCREIIKSVYGQLPEKKHQQLLQMSVITVYVNLNDFIINDFGYYFILNSCS